MKKSLKIIKDEKAKNGVKNGLQNNIKSSVKNNAKSDAKNVARSGVKKSAKNDLQNSVKKNVAKSSTKNNAKSSLKSSARSDAKSRTKNVAKSPAKDSLKSSEKESVKSSAKGSVNFQPSKIQKGAMVTIGVLTFLTFFFSNLQIFFWLKSDWLVGSVLPAVVTKLTNDQRGQFAQKPLARSELLDKAAQFKAEDMAKNGYFAHHSPTGVTPWYWFEKAGYLYAFAGENLAVHFNDSKMVVDAWMNSPSHKANIINGEYTEIGIGTAKGTYDGYDTVFVVQLFGTPAKAKAVKKEAPAALGVLSAAAGGEAAGDGNGAVENGAEKIVKGAGDKAVVEKSGTSLAGVGKSAGDERFADDKKLAEKSGGGSEKSAEKSGDAGKKSAEKSGGGSEKSAEKSGDAGKKSAEKSFELNEKNSLYLDMISTSSGLEKAERGDLALSTFGKSVAYDGGENAGASGGENEIAFGETSQEKNQEASGAGSGGKAAAENGLTGKNSGEASAYTEISERFGFLVNPRGFLPFVYVTLGLLTILALVYSVIFGFRQRNFAEMGFGVILLLVVGGLFFMQYVLTGKVLIV